MGALIGVVMLAKERRRRIGRHERILEEALAQFPAKSAEKDRVF